MDICTSPVLGAPGAGPPNSDTLLLTLRQRPHARVFRALFQYLPLRDSPNENPQLELALAPGDVVLVKGEMDSDGFYRGETLDGRAGLVPSNYVERVPDHVLLANARAPSPSFALRVPPHLAALPHDFSEPDVSQLPDSVCPYPPADVSKVSVQEIKQNDSPRVPCPRDLVIEKKLSRSVVVSWSPPEESFVAVSQYHVCVDGAVRAVVPGSYKCRALVEDVSLDSSVNLSVRALTDQGHSPDAACTITLGNDAAVAPQHLRVWSVTPVTACVRWYPSNSNAEHVVSLNSIKVGVCPPTVFQVQISGLSPSTIYRVSVRTKHPKAVLEQRPVERCLDFKTLPKIGLPDAPCNVQAEHGPQAGTLLVSWTPVSNQPKPPSRAAVHSYLIYADGKNIAQVPSATADHVLLRLADLSDDPPIFLTVRTRTREGAVSSDSNVARVPRGPFSTAAEPLLEPMASSYPSFAPPAGAFSQSALPGGYGPPSMAYNHHQNHHQPSSGPYTAPPMLTSALPNALPFQANPLTSYTASGLQGYNSFGDRCAGLGTIPGSMQATLPGMQPGLPQGLQSALQPMNTSLAGLPSLQMSSGMQQIGGQMQSLGTQMQQLAAGVQPSVSTLAALGPTQLGSSSLPGSHQGTLQGTLPKWKTTPQMTQYYTFHPRFLRTEAGAEDVRPSVIEMENSYLSRHGQQADWAQSDTRARLDAYARQTARTASAEGVVTRHRLVPPRLARVKSESGFGTRSEPDLRPPELPFEGDSRWFVALFDYSHHMSPNANAEHEELSFRKHQLIKVIGEVDADGFYHGVIGSRRGLVPSNMVIEIAKDDLVPRRTRSEAAPAEPVLRRMRWGSLKSRSYDHAERRGVSDRPQPSSYASLDRRDGSASKDRYRRTNGRQTDYEYRRDYDDRYRENRREIRDSRDTRDEPRDYHRDREYRDREEEDYREKYRERDRDRGYDREYERRDDRRGEYDDRRRHDDVGYRRDRREDGYREERPPQPVTQSQYDPYSSRFDPQQGPSGLQSTMGQNHVGSVSQLQQQMGQMQMPSGSVVQPSAPIPQNNSMGQMGQMGQMPMGQMGQQMMGMNNVGGIQGMPGPQAGQQQGYNENGVSTRKMLAKFDYDSRQLSPNVDAEQVELSFRQGDTITVYGDMDEDGFYMGELNGLRGLVPSNFLQSSPTLTSLAPSQPAEPMRKGVAFSDGQPASVAKKTMPARQTSQTSTTPAAAAPAKPAAKKSTAGQPGSKPLTKKTSDVGKNSAPNVRKTSTAVKKSDSVAKKK